MQCWLPPPPPIARLRGRGQTMTIGDPGPARPFGSASPRYPHVMADASIVSRARVSTTASDTTVSLPVNRRSSLTGHGRTD